MDRRRTKQMTSTAVIALYAAVEEVHRNLIHVAIAFDQEWLLRCWPHVSTYNLRSLASTDVRMRLHPEVIQQADAICRNESRFLDFPWESKFVDVPPTEFQAFVSRSFGFLVSAVRFHANWLPLEMRSVGMRDLHSIARDTDPLFGYRSSGISPRACAALRTEDRSLVVWWDDARLDGIRTYEIGQRFLDLAVSHSH